MSMSFLCETGVLGAISSSLAATDGVLGARFLLGEMEFTTERASAEAVWRVGDVDVVFTNGLSVEGTRSMSAFGEGTYLID